jgi:hypothetical protein
MTVHLRESVGCHSAEVFNVITNDSEESKIKMLLIVGTRTSYGVLTCFQCKVMWNLSHKERSP